MIPFRIHRRIPLIRRPFYVIEELSKEIESLRAQLRCKSTGDRTRDLKGTYTAHVERTVREGRGTIEDTVGGHFDYIGQVEVGILQHFGLRPEHFLIDVGCGAGRLARPLSPEHPGPYSGFDIVDDLVDYARETVKRPDWRFGYVDHISIPEADGVADMVCFFSVITHLLHEQSYWYLEEAQRVLRPGGKIVVSFIEFGEEGQWPIFAATLAHTKGAANEPINVFIERNVLETFARRLGLEIECFLNGGEAVAPAGALGQTLCVMQKPR